ncbi:bifunctional glutamate N-acetyltransferase/amino-acid acetyltransferase ArgJ [Auraticoccus monumenti]|uniref:Arginine biosynthesis bifunctional protein ArgJ n=1 Tax=Auraticoccus monumenti TaxID=675864 RepID=A0A1G7CYM3_9ACTN|nr:bifunctional glutamate N-acetyltransferase/amino-acid acetyltransferase ArgJ [Auraticoccus monumenti]SDE43870.1 glutamate N-acetyltransferase [Auraticoccus monumenti]
MSAAEKNGTGVTAAAGFAAAGVVAGLKASGSADLAVVHNLGPLRSAAAVFTRNRVQAAPVVWSRGVVADGSVAAVVLNSGGANACTGPAGLQDATTMAARTADALDVEAGDVVVCSTGLIGTRLPMDRVVAGIEACSAALDPSGGAGAARAIMTTDSRPKESATTVTGPTGTWTVGGMAKGAGMLAPALATMLVVLTTDAVATPETLDRALRAATARTFDRADADGCMSTNDTVVLLASGASGVEVDARTLTEALTEVCADLAHQLVDDAEGAAHTIAITVAGAASEDDALEVGRAVARSNLFKCAVFGRDPNWGRVLAAVGTTSAAFEPDDLDVTFNGVMVCRGGQIGDDRSLVDLSGREVSLLIGLGAGEAEATIWTTDLTHDYVTENAEYST